MSKINRRAFLKSSSGLLALATMDLSNMGCVHHRQSSAPNRAPKGANERINVAIIGMGGRSSAHVNNFGAKKNCRISHVCDADTARAQGAIDKARNSNDGVDPAFVQDLRRVLDDPDVDVVSIVTPNHWHSLAAVWAMQAGKDVYVEKPLSHHLLEGRRVVQVVQQTGRVCQHGSQMRSNSAIIEAIAFVQSGVLGKINVSRALCYKTRPSIGKVSSPQSPPAGVDYNLWCGPAPLAPIMRSKFHYDWHWFWDTGNGDIGNQGIHEMDLARWALDTDAMPQSVQCIGGRFGYIDGGETPNTQIASFDFGQNQPRVIVEVRELPSAAFHTKGVENIVECENGFLVSPSYTSAIAYDLAGNVLQTFEGGGDAAHFDNFLSVVRSRRMGDLNCKALEAHRASAMVRMANISYRLGTPVSLDRRESILSTDPVGNDALDRMAKHLSDNGINPGRTIYHTGRRLRFDSVSERFAGDDQANAMLTHEFRAPFMMPDA